MLARNAWAWLLGGGALAWLLYSQRQPITGALESGEDMITAAVAGWKQVQLGPSWVPTINAVETQFGIPPDLLARMAYQESHFRPDIINGTTASPAGALGIMQLMPHWFQSVRVARPYTPADTEAQIREAAAELVRLMDHYNDWTLAVAAYNDGQGNVDQYPERPLPAETQDYVAAIFADVPLTGSLSA